MSKKQSWENPSLSTLILFAMIDDYYTRTENIPSRSFTITFDTLLRCYAKGVSTQVPFSTVSSVEAQVGAFKQEKG